MPEPFSRYLTTSLAHIERDVPNTYALLRASLGARRLRIEVDGEAVSVWNDGSRLAVGDLRSTDILAVTRRAAIVGLVDGEMSLEEAVDRGAVDLFGAVDDLLAGLDALMAYLNGAARCPELLDLMDAFRRDTV